MPSSFCKTTTNQSANICWLAAFYGSAGVHFAETDIKGYQNEKQREDDIDYQVIKEIEKRIAKFIK